MYEGHGEGDCHQDAGELYGFYKGKKKEQVRVGTTHGPKVVGTVGNGEPRERASRELKRAREKRRDQVRLAVSAIGAGSGVILRAAASIRTSIWQG